MRTLPLRVERMSANALRIATWLKAHPKVADVYYPGLASHPGHDTAARQMQGGFGCLCPSWFRAARPRRSPSSASSSCFTAPPRWVASKAWSSTATPSSRTPASRESLIRVSVGIEDADDLIADLSQALG
jgi:cystathionine gamma-synthase